MKLSEKGVITFLGMIANKWGTGHDSIGNILEKTEDFLKRKSEKISFLNRVVIFVGLLKDYSRQNYFINNHNLGTIIATLVYVVFPIDLLPDMIPVIGFVDDGYFLTKAFKSLSSEIESYKEWKLEQGKNNEIENIDGNVDNGVDDSTVDYYIKEMF